MQKELFVNVDPRETRVAVVEDGHLVELHLEREERVVGSIYKARVCNVLPGMDAAFVDIGLEKNAFLYVGDILATDDYLPPASADEKDSPRSRSHGRRSSPDVKIRDVARTGQELLVQVVKAPRGTKGARVSTRVSLPGRYLVFMPDAANIGISRKIEETKERDRLKKIGDRIRTEGGIIVRTEAEGKSESDLRDDYRYLLNTWKDIQERSRTAPPATILHQELGLLSRVVRDMLSADIYAVAIDSKVDYEKALNLAKALSPRLADKLQPYTDSAPLFEAFGIEREVERLLKPKVWLKSGGYLRIDETEALTSIDVNTGKFVGSTSLNETILRTNLEAVQEIVRQLRFRDLGGMIVLDFIDMSSLQDRQTVMRALDNALKNDRTRTKVAHISPLGLIEMTRKRTGENVTEFLRDACPYCEGRATIQSALSTAVNVDRALREQAAKDAAIAYFVSMHPDVAVEFIGENGAPISKLENDTARAVYVRPDPSAHREKFVIAPADVSAMEKSMKGLKSGKVLNLTIQAYGSGDEMRPIAWHNGILVEIPNGAAYIGQTLPAKITRATRSYIVAELVGVPMPVTLQPDSSVVERAAYPKTKAKSERELVPSSGLEREFTTDRPGRERWERRRKKDKDKEKEREEAPAVETVEHEAEVVVEPEPVAEPVDVKPAAEEAEKAESSRRRRRRRGRRRDTAEPELPETPVAVHAEHEEERELSVAVGPAHEPVSVAFSQEPGDDEEHDLPITARSGGRSRRRWPWRRRRKSGSSESGGSSAPLDTGGSQ